jgi:hypothetical protein
MDHHLDECDGRDSHSLEVVGTCKDAKTDMSLSTIRGALYSLLLPGCLVSYLLLLCIVVAKDGVRLWVKSNDIILEVKRSLCYAARRRRHAEMVEVSLDKVDRRRKEAKMSMHSKGRPAGRQAGRQSPGRVARELSS